MVAVGIGYLCLERHGCARTRRSRAWGTTLWLTALLALSHVLAQPDYPANPGVNAGIAPYFFSSATSRAWPARPGRGTVGARLSADGPRRPRPSAPRWSSQRRAMTAVLHVRPLAAARGGGRFTPFVSAPGTSCRHRRVWALWGGLRRYAARDAFGGYFLLAAFIWILGLLGFLLHFRFRYSIPWYPRRASRGRSASASSSWAAAASRSGSTAKPGRASVISTRCIARTGPGAKPRPPRDRRHHRDEGPGRLRADGAILFRYDPHAGC